MRIQDITVVADPNRHAPAGPDPVEADGSYDGRVDPNSQLPIDTEGLQTTVTDHAICYWTGPWPVLNVVINWEPVSGALIKLHFGFDLLPPFIHLYLENSEMRCFTTLSSELDISEQEESTVYAAAYNFADAFLDAPWFLIATTTRIAMTILGLVAPGNPILLAAFYAASVVYAAAIVMGVIQPLLCIADGTISVLTGVLSLIVMGLSQLIPFGIMGTAWSLWCVNNELIQFTKANGLVSSNRLLQLNQKAGMTLFSLWLTLIMGTYLVGSALLIAVAYGHR